MFKNGANLELELSTTGYARDVATGIVTKTGDVTRTLVGMTNTTVSETLDMVRSYFNDEGTTLIDKIDNAYVYNPTTITSWTAVYQSRYQSSPPPWYYLVPTSVYTMPEMEIKFLAWTDEIVNIGLHFNGADAGANTDFWFHLIVDNVRYYETASSLGSVSTEEELSCSYNMNHRVTAAGIHTVQMGISMPALFSAPHGIFIYRTTNITVFAKR